jgi:CHASE2 domain-containing sensor protein
MRKGAWAVRVTRRNVRLCYANLIAQAALLAVSLAALAYSRDFVPPWLAIVVAVGGVALLAWTLATGSRDSRRGGTGHPHVSRQRQAAGP